MDAKKLLNAMLGQVAQLFIHDWELELPSAGTWQENKQIQVTLEGVSQMQARRGEPSEA